MKRLFLTLFMALLSTTALAQDSLCPTLEYAAVSEAQVWCADNPTGSACYGNSGVSADTISDIQFNTIGDIIPLTDVTQITTSMGDNRYGIALIHTVGYASNNWQAQDVTLAILGDVQIANTGNEGINLQTVTAPIVGEQGANIRSGPSTDFRVITSLFEGDLVKITGRFRDDNYYRMQLPSGETGWIASGAIDSDVSTLPIAETDDTPPELLYAPMTSFSLNTGIDDAGCRDAWASGVLVQSPVDSPVRLQVNDVKAILTGTAFLQADDTRTLIHVIEGEITYQDETTEEGYTVAIFDESNNVFAYDITEFAPLPTQILPRYTYIGVDLKTIITPAPTIDRSPIADVLVDDPCVITTGEGGANLRAGPGSEFSIRGVLAFRETVNPISRISGSDGLVWYELAQNIWVSGQVVVTGGDCLSVPQAQRIPAPLPTATPEN